VEENRKGILRLERLTRIRLHQTVYRARVLLHPVAPGSQDVELASNHTDKLLDPSGGWQTLTVDLTDYATSWEPNFPGPAPLVQIAQPEHVRLLAGVVVERAVGGVQPDGRAGAAHETRDALDVVEVRVREQDRLATEPVCLERIRHRVRLAPRIDGDGRRRAR
jgi:hypothetical protein